MVLVSKPDPVTGKRVQFWEKRFYVHSSVQKIKYRFVVRDYTSNQVLWERDPSRECDFATLSLESSYTKYSNCPNKKTCLKFIEKFNRFVKYDSNLALKFTPTVINESLILGPYPQTTSDMDELAQAGVRAVLNLQSSCDMHTLSLDWKQQQMYYKQLGIKAYNLCILDCKAYDIIDKAGHAATLLDALIEKYQVKLWVLTSYCYRKYIYTALQEYGGLLT